ncbi:MAG: hypothetical protein EBT27_07355 [Betaproteobacteria bacterium]|nr:hypothetical protein [Betaproteobacteria bacterium]
MQAVVAVAQEAMELRELVGVVAVAQGAILDLSQEQTAQPIRVVAAVAGVILVAPQVTAAQVAPVL